MSVPDGRRAAIWDMDGTLVDTAELHFVAWQTTCAANGLPFTRDDFTATFGKRNPEIIRGLFGAQFDDAGIERLAEAKEEAYREAARKAGVEFLPGCRDLVDGLAKLGFAQAIASSAPLANLALILELTGAASKFEALASAEDVSRGKPAPDVFLRAAQKLGVPPARCVVIEDAVVGVEAAKAAGMACIAVRFVDLHGADKLHDAGADRVVDSLEELAAVDVAALI